MSLSVGVRPGPVDQPAHSWNPANQRRQTDSDRPRAPSRRQTRPLRSLASTKSSPRKRSGKDGLRLAHSQNFSVRRPVQTASNFFSDFPFLPRPSPSPPPEKPSARVRRAARSSAHSLAAPPQLRLLLHRPRPARSAPLHRRPGLLMMLYEDDTDFLRDMNIHGWNSLLIRSPVG